MFIVGKLSNEYRKEHKNEQEYMCINFAPKTPPARNVCTTVLE